jgi:uncharacterized protein (TIGR00369 family)
MNLLEWRLLDFDEASSVLRVEMQAKSEFLNPAGFVHGGMLAAMLDETVAPTVAAGLGPGEFAVTLEIKVTFVSPAKVGRIVGTGKVVSKGRTICFLEGQLHDADGILLATATATSKITRSVTPRADA